MPKSNKESLLHGHKRMPWEKLDNHATGTVEQNEFEENEFLMKLNQYNVERFPTNIRRLRRKLLLNRFKRTYIYKETVSDDTYHLRNSHYYSEFGNGSSSIDIQNESIVGIVSRTRHGLIICPYTDRKLKPIILKGINKIPLYLAMHSELLSKVQKLFPHLESRSHKPSAVQFLYVQPDYIPAINALVNTYFWPLVNMNCVLDYKEFSCVAVYKRIVVGFGFMFPGEHLNEGYISFLFVRPHWRNCGIAAFILYHLIQTSYTWDNTLHVSATNPSLFLYQKFGFKFQRMYSGFYNKYLTSESKESRHALYCKLDSDS